MISGYKILEEIHRGRKRVVYRGRRDEDGAPVIIKTLLGDLLSQKDVAALKHEHEILSNLAIPGIVKVYGLEKYDNRLALILEDTGGETLRSLIDAKRIDFTTFFTVGAELSGIVGELHQNNIIHKDINPKNIIFNSETGSVKMIDFSISSLLPFENPKINHPNLLEGTLAYISPEQTGRMNRAIDYRTDFYSLGITFYEMLTGRPPFDSSDPLELVHSHIAKVPPWPGELNPDIPQAVSDIVMKLLAKTAEERYKSGFGLKSDLERCSAEWQRNGKVARFRLGEKDFSDRFYLPQKLYGRETEIETLMETFRRVCDGTTEMMLVSGYPGIGKSALVNEVHKPIARERGYFVSGKFDQLKRNIPYSAVIQALQELIRLILTESEREVEAWRDKLANSLALNGQVIIDVIPEVGLIIGEQPPVPDLSPTESQNRFNLVFERFIGVFSQKEHPLVVFLDDLQWADPATLKLLETLITDADMKYLLLIGAYRDNEVGPAHPLIQTLSEINKSGARISNIILKPLSFTPLNQFVADTLRSDTVRSKPLTEMVLSKTDGNPFFVTQFLKSLYQERLVHIDYASGQWSFDLGRIEQRGITDNVVELMGRKIERLSEETQRVLRLAACIGNQFDLNTLSIVNEKPPSATARDLWEAVREGLILLISDGSSELNAGAPMKTAETFSGYETESSTSTVYKFLHDRVQQAAYASIPDIQRQPLHLTLGRLLQEGVDPEETDERLFDIVHHLNLGCILITDTAERLTLARLNLSAGRKAKSSTAHEAALNYLYTGLSLLDQEAWQSDYDLAFDLNFEAAECQYLCGNFEAAEQSLELLLERAVNKLEKARVYRLRSVQLENMARYADALAVARENLALFGVSFPDSSEEKEGALQNEIESIASLLGERPIESLIDLPVMTNHDTRMVMSILTDIWSTAYILGVSVLARLISATMVRLSLIQGNVEESAYGYVTHAITVGPVRGDYKSAYEFGSLALKVNERFNDSGRRAKIYQQFHAHVNLWRQPMETCIPYAREACRSGLESGDFLYAAYGACTETWPAFLATNDLAQFVRDYSPNLELIEKLKVLSFGDALRIMLNWARALQGRTRSPVSLSEQEFDENEYRHAYGENPFFMTFYAVAKLHLAYLSGEYDLALEAAALARGFVYRLSGTIWPVIFEFWNGLTLAANYTAATEKEQKAHLEEMEKGQRLFSALAESCPENYFFQKLVLSAEIDRVTGDQIGAQELYERAIAYARETNMLQHRALANELYAGFLLESGQEKRAAVFMVEARAYYAQWSAMAKVRMLEQKYPRLLSRSHLERGADISDMEMTLSTIRAGSETLDLMSVVKASQAISGEIVLEGLLERLMKIAIQNAGAERGMLILEKAGELVIKAEGSVERNEVAVLNSIPVETQHFASLPQTILNYVKRTRESVVLADASNDPQFAQDPYIVQKQPKSILCIPILLHGKFIGILHLENNLTADAFTQDRVEVVRILSSQAAISLENARLYDESKRTAAELRFLNDLVEQATQPVAVSDFDGRLVRFNRAYEKLTGYSGEELRHMTYQQLTPQAWHEMETEQVSRLMKRGQTVRYEKEYLRKDGTRVPLELVVDVYRNAAGEPIYLYAFVTDITERKRAEEALRQALSEVEQLKNRLQAENIYLQEEIKSEYNFEEIIGQSESLRKVLRSAEQVAPTDTSVLILGETGTGKEILARVIHNLSRRRDRPLVKVNCGAISAGLVESELFGHEKGAFTGAMQRRIGRFELADGGTLFLDEVGELPLDTQVKLLRVLQEGEFERVGSSKPIKVDVRVIAATNRDLSDAVKSGAFRSDLYYRLNVFPLEVPPLRERKSDIPLLVNFFITKFAKSLGKQVQGVSRQIMNKLINYPWPGNIRELQNIIERAVVVSFGPTIQIDESILGLNSDNETVVKETLEEVERTHIIRALEQTNWVIHGKHGAASILGINPNTLRSRMEKMGIRKVR